MHRLLTVTLSLLLGILGTATTWSAGASAAEAAYIASIAPEVSSYGESTTVTFIVFGGPRLVIRVNGVVAPVVSATGTRVRFRVPLGVPKVPVAVTAPL